MTNWKVRRKKRTCLNFSFTVDTPQEILSKSTKNVLELVPRVEV